MVTTDIDAAVGADGIESIELNGKDYRIAPFGPYLLGEIINYIKKRKRSEIIATANEIGEKSFVKVSEFISRELKKINEDSLDEYLEDMDIITHLVYFNLKVWQPELTYLDMGKYFSIEKITETAAKIMDDLPSDTKDGDPENPKKQEQSEQIGQQQ